MMSVLHHHHQAEDELLWPVLHQRVPAPVRLLFRLVGRPGYQREKAGQRALIAA